MRLGENVNSNINSNSNARRYLTFVLDGENYGVDILAVQELLAWQETTPLVTPAPNASAFMLGAINLRGLSIPVLDLRACLGLADSACAPKDVVVVLNLQIQGASRVMGLRVDAVSSVHEVSADQVRLVSGLENTMTSRWVTTWAKMDDAMVMLLDAHDLVQKNIALESESTNAAPAKTARKLIHCITSNYAQMS